MSRPDESDNVISIKISFEIKYSNEFQFVYGIIENNHIFKLATIKSQRKNLKIKKSCDFNNV